MRVILGKPVPFARPGQTATGKRYTPARYREWKTAAAWQMKGERHYDRPVRIRIVVRNNRIEYEFAETEQTRPKGLRGDLDNYTKAVLDAAQDAGVIEDDRQVVSIEVMFDNRKERQ